MRNHEDVQAFEHHALRLKPHSCRCAYPGAADAWQKKKERKEEKERKKPLHGLHFKNVSFFLATMHSPGSGKYDSSQGSLVHS